MYFVENEYLEVKKITNQEKNLFQANKNEKGEDAYTHICEDVRMHTYML